MITAKTATDIALAYREIETAESLLADVEKQIEEQARRLGDDIRDVFGRRVYGLELGVPSGKSGHRCFNVPWSLARPVLQAHVANCRATLLALTETARIELNGAGPSKMNAEKETT